MTTKVVGVAKFSLSKKKLLVGVGVVLLLGAAAGAGVWLRWFQVNTGNQGAKSGNKISPSIITAENLYQKGQTDAAKQELNDAINDPSTSSDEKYDLYISEGNMDIDKQDFQGALNAFLKAGAVKETSDIDSKIGSTYQKVGDNTQAIVYYKKAIAINPDSNPLKERQNEVLTEMIKNLGGQP